ncbi:hypothetical protein F442_10720 [Phytophthora nicotianae P10297]|uniref:Uncharacterized protein n=2 Tax=Phytophthora nicotianae TaxID=4792 RepID=W2Z505_PHYNI|nr:hypothetical protein F442_10720 [Phytophthora nicotianae P10297]
MMAGSKRWWMKKHLPDVNPIALTLKKLYAGIGILADLVSRKDDHITLDTSWLMWDVKQAAGGAFSE